VLLRSAFIATMPRNKRPSVWKRAAKPRLPIEKQLGPSVPRLVIEKGIFEAVRSRAQQTLAKNMAHETEYLLSRQKGRRG